LNDRLDKYFAKYLEGYVFLELMPDYVKREHLDFMRHVPMPVKKEQVGGLTGDQGIEFKHFTMGMINIIGINPSFQFVPQYVNFLKYINNNIEKAMVLIGIEQAKALKLELACITLRAALVIAPDNPDALYNYMLVCRNLYLDSDSNSYITDFKTEVLESLIKLKEVVPDFDKTYYYLGFAYINAGKYSEAKTEWNKFIRLSGPCRERLEIRGRLAELEDPIRIEQGYNDVINGNWDEGLEILETYIDTDKMDWWPLPYYLGVGYSRTGRYKEALEMLKQALQGNPSSAEIMAELVIVNNALGDEVNAEKYKRKLDILRKDIEQLK
jgi:tetratricopeptide (TPR) repeat protein